MTKLMHDGADQPLQVDAELAHEHQATPNSPKIAPDAPAVAAYRLSKSVDSALPPSADSR